MKKFLPAIFAFYVIRQVAASDFTVTNTNATGPGSLYQAITDANNMPGADRILFNIPGPGIHTITVNGGSPLPPVVESLIIDGYSQPGAKQNSALYGDNAVILVQIDGGAGGADPAKNGLLFNPGSGNALSNYTVRGLCLTGFFGSTNNITFGTAITAGVVDSLVVTGNFIGILPDGETARANWVGVGHVTQLGGTDAASRNIISGNWYGFNGEVANGAGPAAAIVQGNYIGTNATGTKAVPNVVAAIALGSGAIMHCNIPQFDLSGTLIGGSGARNVISGNSTAISLGGFCSTHIPLARTGVNGVRIEGNAIGLQSSGGGALPNGSGIAINVGSNNTITGNAIKFNDSGVTVQEGTGNEISGNSIHQNRRIGIDLRGDGVTPNDLNDSDDGPNNLQNYPIITSAKLLGPSSRGMYFVTGTGTLNSTPNSTFRLEFFINSASSGAGQGELFNGVKTVTTDANGNASFDWGFETDPGRPVYTVTATDSLGNTSEFSPAFPPPAQLLNLSTRTPVGTGENALIGGFIVAGTDGKKVLLRGLGPSLTQAGINGALADPTLELRDSTGALLAFNNNWKDSQENEISQTGIAPTDDLEAAILATLPAKSPDQGGASYTGILAGNGGKTGIGLLEIYDLAASANSKLVNISTRGFVGGGEAVLIGGVIPGPTERSPTRVLIRGIGPSLAAHGVNTPLQDPLLEIHNANGTTILQNDNWSEASNASEISATGIPPTDSRESAILMPLSPGSDYTAVVSGAHGGTGVALVEVYALN